MGLQEFFRGLAGLLRWWVVVAPWEQAVRVRLGKHVRVLGAGIYWRIPGVDRIYRQSIRRRFSSVPTQTVTTKDGRAVTVSGALGYRIEDIGKLYDTLHHAEDTVQTEAAALVARFVRDCALAECTPGAVEESVTKALDLSRYGIGGVEFAITDFVAVRTYRLIQGEPKNYSHDGGSLSTTYHEQNP